MGCRSVAAMATERDLCFTPAVELLKLYRTRRVSPLEVMQAVLARIDAVNPRVNAIVTLTRESALESGLPVALKIVGKRRGEATVLRAAAAFEQAQPRADCIPPVVRAEDTT